ncbi:heme-copper oxidase subunit III [filamentous cyanobacterium LEGE 11480]|uniref:Oxidase aa(3) subunit 3 n=1 Tax=Romeriopsis navalis LEGE 11480 TaxID=2777977 RepID=A0A928Z3C0_9CYAN|nr:heme-copper oxidase subunit III [Romeriopsis navalis]MBE9029882.1 heme-copper oxidase subunit III [Romeriopsis navalis LEGE 11480]
METPIATDTLPVEATAEEHPDFRTFGLFTFLLSESLMFGALFAVYLSYRGGAAEWPPAETEVELLLPALNTVLLVSSSFVINLGNKAVKNNDIPGLRKWFGITALMGTIFLGGQVYEYMNLGYGLSTNVFSNCFYMMTGFHGLHVLLGVCLILGVVWRSQRDGHYSSHKHTGVEMAEIYWHFVDIIWIILFALIYILTLF